jgi:hypothetical protein
MMRADMLVGMTPSSATGLLKQDPILLPGALLSPFRNQQHCEGALALMRRGFGPVRARKGDARFGARATKCVSMFARNSRRNAAAKERAGEPLDPPSAGLCGVARITARSSRELTAKMGLRLSATSSDAVHQGRPSPRSNPHSGSIRNPRKL